MIPTEMAGWLAVGAALVAALIVWMLTFCLVKDAPMKLPFVAGLSGIAGFLLGVGVTLYAVFIWW